MHLRTAVERGIRGRIGAGIGAGIGALALLTGLSVTAAPAAQADGNYCGHNVVGDIEKRYNEMGGPGGVLGCPLTEELVNPDGAGRRTQFEHGTIYWSPRSGAWPVWGEIGQYWCDQGCEQGKMGYPTSYERRVGDEIQQHFQCALIHYKALPDGVGKMWRDYTCV
ncbi:hypothetical protein GCM10009647_038760 [Streptomyces sanglieri]|uniref:LGFP repeat-containing protein n=1 Tax=Streptomyces sanglieri TaxID=193460 RepID=A0ABW2X0R1_9ACTN|nr:hypothetical protein [Streptomyces sp. Wh19]MDV9196813.1 hypothetical protein [Streptomyces sp. Wh19]